MRANVKYGIRHLLIVMVAVGAGFGWWQLSVVWDSEHTWPVLDGRPSNNSDGFVLFTRTITVYEDGRGREVPAPWISRSVGWIAVGVMMAFALASLGIAARRRSTAFFDLGMACLAVVLTIAVIEVVPLIQSFVAPPREAIGGTGGLPNRAHVSAHAGTGTGVDPKTPVRRKAVRRNPMRVNLVKLPTGWKGSSARVLYDGPPSLSKLETDTTSSVQRLPRAVVQYGQLDN